MKKLVIIGTAFVLVAAAVIILMLRPAKGSLDLTINPAGSTVKIDNKEVAGTTLSLDPGSHTVVVQHNDYITQTKTITIEKGKTTKLAIILLKKTTDTIVSQTVLQDIYQKNGIDSLSVLNSTSLYNGSWIVATVKTNSDPAQVVLKKNDSGGFDIYLGPGTSFDPDMISQLPVDVRTALNNGLKSP